MSRPVRMGVVPLRSAGATVLAISIMCLIAISVVGCAEQPAPAPVALGPRPAAVAEEPSPVIVSPHIGRATAPRTQAPIPSGGGGGGRPPVTAADRARMERDLRDRLAREPADPGADPCEEQRRLAGIGADAVGRREPGRAEMPPCAGIPQRDCLSPDYLREHADECQEQFERLANRGERRVERMRREYDERMGRTRGPRIDMPVTDDEDDEPLDGVGEP
ncbi:MAG: hypothetical protein IT378_13735 [Sandaracinaceae bacterium]|nr:hypothetical protein [Sandaracinaceae bacterium]